MPIGHFIEQCSSKVLLFRKDGQTRNVLIEWDWLRGKFTFSLPLPFPVGICVSPESRPQGLQHPDRGRTSGLRGVAVRAGASELGISLPVRYCVFFPVEFAPLNGKAYTLSNF